MQPDSTLIPVIAGHIHTLAPWLADGIVNWVATYAAGVPIVVVLFGYEWTRTLLQKYIPTLAKLIAAKHLERWSFIINPILGALVGQFGFGHAGLGIVAGGVYATTTNLIQKAGKVDIKTVTKMGTAAAGMALAAALAFSTASADTVGVKQVQLLAPTPKVSLVDASRFHWGLAMTARYEQDGGTLSFRGLSPAWGVKPSMVYMWSNHLNLNGNVWRQVTEKSNRWVGEAGVGLAF